MKKLLAVTSVVTAVALTLTGCAADVVNGAAAQAESTRPVETSTVQANTFDLNFINQIRPLLQDTVALSGQLLASEGIDPEVRKTAQTSMNRQQDEIIQLNSLLEQWGTIGESTEGVTDVLPEASRTNDVEPTADLRRMSEAGRAEFYLTELQERLELMISLAEEEILQGESPQLRDQAELMIQVKSERLRQIDALLAAED